MLKRSLTLNSQAELRAFLSTNMLLAGYTQELSNSDFLAFKKRNSLMGEDADGYFNVVFIVDGTNVGITTCSELPSTNLIPKTDAPKSSNFSTNYRASLLVTDYTVILSLRDKSTGNTETFVMATVDYRELDLSGLDDYPGVLINYRNNGQCVFQVGLESSGRVLYAGDSTNAVQFNKPMDVDTPSFNPASKLSIGGTLFMSTVAVTSEGKYLGLLKDVFLTQNSAMFYLDRPVDQYGREYVFFRDSVGNSGVVGLLD